MPSFFFSPLFTTHYRQIKNLVSVLMVNVIAEPAYETITKRREDGGKNAFRSCDTSSDEIGNE